MSSLLLNTAVYLLTLGNVRACFNNLKKSHIESDLVTGNSLYEKARVLIRYSLYEKARVLISYSATLTLKYMVTIDTP